jgi:3-phenylpropionate/trans-cinnamate dioxygenase ferredoxin subunit
VDGGNSDEAALRPGAGFERVARLEALPERGLLAVQTARGEPLCLVRDGGMVRAVRDVCPHADFPLSEGTLLPGCELECVWHGARFDVRTGAVRRPPAEEPLTLYETQVVDGEIWVRTA